MDIAGVYLVDSVFLRCEKHSTSIIIINNNGVAENRKTLISAWVHFQMELSKNISLVQYVGMDPLHPPYFFFNGYHRKGKNV